METITIETYGSQVKTINSLLEALVDEARVELTEDGIQVKAVDPVTVAMIYLEVDAEGFDAYEYETDAETVRWGLAVDRLKKALNTANKGQGLTGGDDITLTLHVENEGLGEPEVGRVEAEIETEDMTLTDVFFALDPGSIHQLPDMPNTSDAFVASQELPTAAFRDAVKHITARMDYVIFSANDVKDEVETRIYGETEDERGNEVSASASFPDAETVARNMDRLRENGGVAESQISRDYIKPIAAAVHAGGRMGTLNASWGDDYPVEFEFSLPDWEMSGTYMVAPRIEDE